MIGMIGHAALSLAFLLSIAAVWFYYRAARTSGAAAEKVANSLFMAKGLLVLFASVLLVYLLFTHQFQYYYVYNYTSTDLQAVYLWAAFYSGQEGSLLLWILSSFITGLALIRWTTDEYRAPVMVFMGITQVFLISMVSGFPIPGSGNLGASPFRTLISEMPDAAVFRENPDFVPSEGSGLNDLLRSPWIIIHPPVIFLGFAMMTVPYAFALASLWKRKYHEWIHVALPWTLGANLCLLTAIFLGGYWAYVTLSFGGYWAWDPVENASLVPWIFGMAGIHAMLIQKKHARSHKASIIFAILAYTAIVYQTFLTRSGILGEASVHSFVDLGLYNQLLVFMLVVGAIGAVLFIWRYRELPEPGGDPPLLSREFMMFAGAMVLFLAGLVILLGTSSPIIGRLFVAQPTPPDQSFYNTWSLPFGVLIGIMTVVTQYLWWEKHNGESLATALIGPALVTSVVTVFAIIRFDIQVPAQMIYLFAAVFAVAGNGSMMIRLFKRNPARTGGTITHIGFAVLMIGILGSAFDRPMVDARTSEYNRAVAAGQVHDDAGFRVDEPIGIVELEKGVPKLIDGTYMVTFLDAEVTERNRPGEQEYEIRFEDIHTGKSFVMKPVVYPMLANSPDGAVEWTVDPSVKRGWFSDIFMYVAGSSLVEREIERMEQDRSAPVASFDQLGPQEALERSGDENRITIPRGSSAEWGGYTLTFRDFLPIHPDSLPPGSIIGVRADLLWEHQETGEQTEVAPSYILVSEGDETWVLNPPEAMDEPEGASARFVNVFPAEDRIELEILGLEGEPVREWILLSAEKKPLISIVWIGTFLLMAGFSVSIFYRWADQKKRERAV
ncbi:cytochrome c biogenesis protein CcsA [Balneolaceae bacterium ANBcel3]|nr:cytochrome c biogenesis protein CcsA [Balneolaceae bacterium ANBcel3]